MRFTRSMLPRSQRAPVPRALFAGELALWLVGALLLTMAALPTLRARSYAARHETLLGSPRLGPSVSRSTGSPIESIGAIDPLFLGRIEIPRVGVSAMVREGVDDATLDLAVGHIPGTPRPGEPGNVALAGHRDSFFEGLREIRLADEIRIETPRGPHRYVVESTEIVHPEDVRVIAPTKDDVLTLVTCYPFKYVGNAPKRFIVRARLVTGT